MKKFMQGRNGPDQLGQFVLSIGFLLSLINLFLKSNILSSIILVLLIYALFRTFSKQTYKRRQENIQFAKRMYPYSQKVYQCARRLQERKIYKYFKCPNCKQTLRVPRGHGEITVTCPKCHHQFDKRS